MKKTIILFLLLATQQTCFCWGFYGHRKINNCAVFLLPPEMLVLYKPFIVFLTDHSVDPDRRRYMVKAEGPRHYIDIDHYGAHAFDSLPKKWKDAVEKYSEDSLHAHGIVPWWIQTMMQRLTTAFKEKNQSAILKLSAEIGHYIADAHVPLHASSNHNGQLTNQIGIHGFWESRIPELLADKEWDFFIGKAEYIKNPADYIWSRVKESAAASDTVLRYERELTEIFPQSAKYAFEEKNGKILRQYSTAFTKAYDAKLKGMVERRMRQAIFSVASFWYTAWVNAGQPDLSKLRGKSFTEEEQKEFEKLSRFSDSHE
jgi:hypothetical protein